MRSPDSLPPIETLRELFRYDPKTGHLFWKVRAPSRPVNRPAGSADPRGYWQVSINKRLFRSHRVIFALVYGRWPQQHIDHIDGNRSNNKITNLREANGSENICNAKVHFDSKSGIKGVNWHKVPKKWCARITVNKRGIFLGYFDSIESAAAARRAAAEKLHGVFARHE